MGPLQNVKKWSCPQFLVENESYVFCTLYFVLNLDISCYYKNVGLVETIPKSPNTTGESVTRVSFPPINCKNFCFGSHLVIEGSDARSEHE